MRILVRAVLSKVFWPTYEFAQSRLIFKWSTQSVYNRNWHWIQCIIYQPRFKMSGHVCVCVCVCQLDELFLFFLFFYFFLFFNKYIQNYFADQSIHPAINWPISTCLNCFILCNWVTFFYSGTKQYNWVKGCFQMLCSANSPSLLFVKKVFLSVSFCTNELTTACKYEKLFCSKLKIGIKMFFCQSRSKHAFECLKLFMMSLIWLKISTGIGTVK